MKITLSASLLEYVCNSEIIFRDVGGHGNGTGYYNMEPIPIGEW
jgi:hypothetical protein